MGEPVLVVHGVANRNKKAFEDRVRTLNARVGEGWTFLPVFWGDLGTDADDDMLGALPAIRALPDDEMRALDEGEEALPESTIAWWLGEPDVSLAGTRASDAGDVSPDQEEAIMAGWQERASGDGLGVRNITDLGQAEHDIRAVIQNELPNTRYLKHIHDPALLETVGRLLSDATAREAHAGGTGDPGFAVRGDDEVETRGFQDRMGEVLRDIDDLVGRTVGKAVGRGNQKLRRSVAPWAVRFVGDIIAYTGRQDQVHARFWKAISDWQQEAGTNTPYGTAAHPINVIAHSLGGVAAFDLAVAETNPLHIRHFFTFGSQAAFFHAVMPRAGVTPYTRGNPARLPASPPRIQSWTNLWEPMDLVAFTVGDVFRLPQKDSAEPARPTDQQIDTGITDILDSKLWTHSTYWDSDEIVPAIRRAFGDAA